MKITFLGLTALVALSASSCTYQQVKAERLQENHRLGQELQGVKKENKRLKAKNYRLRQQL